MNLYQELVAIYAQFLGLFPVSIQWVITLLVIIGLVGAFIGLIRRNPIFIIVLVLLLPLIAPIVQSLIADIYHFFLYLIGLLGATAPHS